MPPDRRGALGAGALGTLALLAACRSPPPVLYTILPTPGEARRGGPRTVVVREVMVARYLDRLPIVRSAEDYRLDVSSDDWWGEPLEGMLTRVLVENLAQRLPGASVYASEGAISAPADATVAVNLRRLGMTGPAVLTLTAQVAIEYRDPRRRDVTRTESLTVPVQAGSDTRAFVAAASAAVGRLSDSIAALLTG